MKTDIYKPTKNFKITLRSVNGISRLAWGILLSELVCHYEKYGITATLEDNKL